MKRMPVVCRALCACGTGLLLSLALRAFDVVKQESLCHVFSKPSTRNVCNRLKLHAAVAARRTPWWVYRLYVIGSGCTHRQKSEQTAHASWLCFVFDRRPLHPPRAFSVPLNRVVFLFLLLIIPASHLSISSSTSPGMKSTDRRSRCMMSAASGTSERSGSTASTTSQP